MKKKVKSLFRKVCNKLFLLLAKGIIEKKSDGSIHIYSDVIVYGNVSARLPMQNKSVDADSPLSKKCK